MLLENQVALVTGAARGIGKGVALALARAGANMAVTDISGEGVARTAEEIRSAGGCAESFVAELRAAPMWTGWPATPWRALAGSTSW